MKQNAEEFNKSPALAYRKADKGERVEIHHDRYPEKVFVLSAQEKGLNWDNKKDKDLD